MIYYDSYTGYYYISGLDIQFITEEDAAEYYIEHYM